MFDIVVENNEKKEIERVNIKEESDNCFWISITTLTKRIDSMFGSGMDDKQKKYMSVNFYAEDGEESLGQVKIYSDKFDMFAFYRAFVEHRYGVDFIIFIPNKSYKTVGNWKLT